MTQQTNNRHYDFRLKLWLLKERLLWTATQYFESVKISIFFECQKHDLNLVFEVNIINIALCRVKKVSWQSKYMKNESNI